MQPRISRLEETDIMPPPPTRTQFPLKRPVNARVKAGLCGKEGAPLPLLLWKGQGCGWHLSSGCPGFLPSPVGLEEEERLRRGCRKGTRERRGWRTRGGTRLCYHCLSGGGAECKSASVTCKFSPQAAAIERLLTHFNIDRKETPTFLFFFLKCKKLSAALERGSLDRPFNAK